MNSTRKLLVAEQISHLVVKTTFTRIKIALDYQQYRNRLANLAKFFSGFSSLLGLLLGL